MCGLTGFLQSGALGAHAQAQVEAMAARLHHRGPDDGGAWVDAEAGVALGHRRLAIVDLSPAGHQPMHSASGRWVLAFNGEIYNHLGLRRELEAAGAAPSWRGHSDTETLLAAIEAWGVDTTLRRCAGMFALAAWDRHERALWLGRDRIGEKPLYYGWQGNVFLFGSELKALRVHPAFAAQVDRGALALLLRHNYIPAPHSIYQGIHKLPPGTWLRLGGGVRDVAAVSYWSLAEVAERGMAEPFAGSEGEAVDALERWLGAAVAGQMVADVPLGALLSGGIDSTLITALMQARSARPVRTFTIGFEEGTYDEATYARAVAAHLGTEHTELRLTGADALALVPRLPELYDEPFADPSQLPTFLVSRLARQQVTVALTGDGGDELFAGYSAYPRCLQQWNTWRKVPAGWRDGVAGLAGAAASAPWLADGPSRGGVRRVRKLAAKLAGRAARLRGATPVAMLAAKRSACDRPQTLVPGGRALPTVLTDEGRIAAVDDPLLAMQQADMEGYLTDDILVKVDRAAMAVSLETRAPFLDRDVVEFAWSLPMSMKLRDGRGKWILRQLLDRHVPRALVDRPKMGFGIPLDDWLRGPLRDWAEALLDEDRLRREGYLDPAPVRAAWQLHLQRKASFGYRLWSVLMFQAWLEQVEGDH